VLGWWFAFTRDIRRERGFTLGDMPVSAFSYGEPPRPAISNTEAP
jgi:hypothetical protein